MENLTIFACCVCKIVVAETPVIVVREEPYGAFLCKICQKDYDLLCVPNDKLYEIEKKFDKLIKLSYQ